MEACNAQLMAKTIEKCSLCQSRRLLNYARLCKRCNKDPKAQKILEEAVEEQQAAAEEALKDAKLAEAEAAEEAAEAKENAPAEGEEKPEAKPEEKKE